MQKANVQRSNQMSVEIGINENAVARELINVNKVRQCVT